MWYRPQSIQSDSFNKHDEIYLCLSLLLNVSHLAQLWIFQGILVSIVGHAVAHLVKALRYKPEGRGFDSR
jgi:hypothetical protein